MNMIIICTLEFKTNANLSRNSIIFSLQQFRQYCNKKNKRNDEIKITHKSRLTTS